MAAHSEQEIWEACEAQYEAGGPAALRRETVQEELMRRAEQAGREPKGATNAVVGKVIREFLKQRGQARAAAREADVAQAASGEVPQGILDLVTRFGETLAETVRNMVREVQQRAAADAEARVAAAERAAAGRVAELAGELESLRVEHDSLSADHAQTNDALDERDRQIASLTASLGELEAAVQTRDAEARRRVAELETELRAVSTKWLEADARAHAAELAEGRAEREVARVEERLSAERNAREEWVRWAARQEERATSAEARAEQLRVRLKLAAGGDVGAKNDGEADHAVRARDGSTATPLKQTKSRRATRREGA